MVSSRLSYDREVVDRTVLTSQSVPPAPPWQLGGGRVEDSCKGWRSLYIGTAIWCLYMQLQFLAAIPICDIHPLVITVK